MSAMLDGWKGVTLTWNAKTMKRLFAPHTVVLRKRAYAMTANERVVRYTPSAWVWVCKCGAFYIDGQGLGWDMTLNAATQHMKGIE